ncbi:hypothetical protein [uncultured Algibacter sp.]|uniref:hypothetical protein n=1 Tax=uncultured Algibacter sp. TaxID=298659 RepID=UPI002617D172|nr:hypothetical protein [uncultured Algibacter sp.]
MKKLAILFILMFSIQINAQTFSSSLSNNIITSYKDSASASTKGSPVLQFDYVIEAHKMDTGYLEVTIKSSKDGVEDEVFSLKPLSIDLFKPKFEIHFKNSVKNSGEANVTEIEELNDAKISILFARLISFERTEDERPVVAILSLNENIPVVIPYNKIEPVLDVNDKPKNDKDGKPITKIVKYYEIINIENYPKVELTFYNGFIEKIELETKVLGHRIRFSNLFSIGISSSDGIRKFNNHKLQSFNSFIFKDGKLSKPNINSETRGQYLEINFSDIIDYDREIDINANDISPEPTKLVLDEVQKTTKLYKPESTKLFEAIVYSDFFGVFDEENPNGIIQTEIAKKFYINTKRKQNRWYSYILPPAWYSDAIGVAEYINLNVKISKLEENNKFLKAEQIGNENYFSPLSLKQHESFSIGADINLFSFENQNKKINTFIELGWNYGRSGLEFSDQAEDQTFLNTITTSANIAFHIIPEKRYGFIASNRISKFMVLNDDLIESNEFSFKSLKNGELVEPNKWFNSSQIEFYLNTSSTGKLFMRYSLVSDLKDFDNNFSQFQFGYSFYILRQNGKIK